MRQNTKFMAVFTLILLTMIVLTGCGGNDAEPIKIEINTWGDAVELMFRSFWTFIGGLILITLAVRVAMEPFKTVNSIHKRWVRARTIRKNGYPPAHCDTEGTPYDKIVLKKAKKVLSELKELGD